MSVSLLQSKNIGSGSGTTSATASGSLSQNVQLNSLLIAVVNTKAAGTLQAPTISISTGDISWVAIGGPSRWVDSARNTSGSVNIFYAAGVPPISNTATFSATATQLTSSSVTVEMQVYEFSGISTNSVLDVISVGQNGTVPSAGILTTNETDLVFVSFVSEFSNNTALGQGYSVGIFGSQVFSGTQYIPYTDAGAINTSFSNAVGTNACIAVGFKAIALPRYDLWVKDRLGRGVAGAQIFVCSNSHPNTSTYPPSPLVPIYYDLGGLNPISEPLYTDNFGHGAFYVAPGTYTIVISVNNTITEAYPDQTIGFSSSGSSVNFVSGDGALITNALSTGNVDLTLGPASNVFAGPSSGSKNAAPTYRTLVAADIPTLPYLQITGGTINGPLTLLSSLKDSNSSAGTNHQALMSTGAAVKWLTVVGGGSVTSVAWAGSGVLFSATPSAPVTAAGNLSPTLLQQSANTVFLSPDGVSGIPSFRSLLLSDIPLGIGNSKLQNSTIGLVGDGTLFSNSTVSIALGSSGSLVLLSERANMVFSGASSGSAATPGFRSLAIADLPTNIPNANLQHSSISLTGDGTVFSNSLPGSISLGSSGAFNTLVSQTKNTILAGPSSGVSAASAFRTMVENDLPPRTTSISYVIGDGTNAIQTGTAGQVYIPRGCTIQSVELQADQSGSAVVDILTCTYSGFPGSLTSITASDIPTLSSAQKYFDSGLTGWTTSIPAGNILNFNVLSASTVTQITITINGTA